MADPEPLAPRHVGAALSLTGLVVLMTGEGTRPDVLALACGCLGASLMAFAVDICRTPKRARSRNGRRPGAPRAVAAAPETAQWEAVPARSALPHETGFHPALSAPVRGARPLPVKPVPPVVTALHRRALKDVRNRRIARGT